MRVIRRTVNAIAVLIGANVVLHMDTSSPLTWAACILCGFFAAFPVDSLRRLYLLVTDKRPRPRIWPTVVLADPQDGYPEEDGWSLVGVVTERR